LPLFVYLNGKERDGEGKEEDNAHSRISISFGLVRSVIRTSRAAMSSTTKRKSVSASTSSKSIVLVCNWPVFTYSRITPEVYQASRMCRKRDAGWGGVEEEWGVDESKLEAIGNTHYWCRPAHKNMIPMAMNNRDEQDGRGERMQHHTRDAPGG